MVGFERRDRRQRGMNTKLEPECHQIEDETIIHDYEVNSETMLDFSAQHTYFTEDVYEYY